MIYLRVTCLLIGSFFLFTFFPLMFVKSRNFGLLASFSFRSFASKHTLSVFRKCFRQLKVIPAAFHLIHNISFLIKTSESKIMNHRNKHLCYHSIILERNSPPQAPYRPSSGTIATSYFSGSASPGDNGRALRYFGLLLQLLL